MDTKQPKKSAFQMTKQYQDSKGYIRALTYNKSITILTSPLLPSTLCPIEELNILSLKKENIDNVLKFAQQMRYQFLYKDTKPSGALKGVWMVPSQKRSEYSKKPSQSYAKLIHQADHPHIGLFDALPQAPLTWIPVLLDKGSVYEMSKEMNMIAKHLCHIALYAYSKAYTKKGTDGKIFRVSSSNKYLLADISDVIPPKNSSFYVDGLVIVTSKEMQTRLEGFIDVELFNNKQTVIGFKKRPFFPPQNVTANHYTFYSRESLLEWASLSSNLVDDFKVCSNVLEFYNSKPYFFKRQGRVYLVQNMNTGKMSDCVALINYWNDNGVNKGVSAKAGGEIVSEKDINLILRLDGTSIVHPNDKPNVSLVEYNFTEEFMLMLSVANKSDYVVQHKIVDEAYAQAQKYIRFPEHEKGWWIKFLSFLLEHYGQYINVSPNLEIKTSDMGALALNDKNPFKVYAAMLLV